MIGWLSSKASISLHATCDRYLPEVGLLPRENENLCKLCFPECYFSSKAIFFSVDKLQSMKTKSLHLICLHLLPFLATTGGTHDIHANVL